MQPQREGRRQPAVRALKSPKGLHLQLADMLRERLQNGEWAPGDQLPTEKDLTADYGVSRSTVRGALQLLEAQGRTTTRHGVGTFVTQFAGQIKSGLQELQSMSDTIRAHGMTPDMEYHSAGIRPAAEDEARSLGIEPGTSVFATQRAVLADDEVVAYSYDAIPRAVLPDDFDPAGVSGSLFHLLEDVGVEVTTAVAELHATSSQDIGWGDHPRSSAYLLLDQVHYSQDGVAVLAAKTYFIEGRFQFSVLRVR